MIPIVAAAATLLLAGLMLVGGWLVARTRHRATALLWSGGLVLAFVGLALGALHYVQAKAMAGSEFNSTRWVVLAPWGRAYYAAAFVVGGAIIGLAWHSTRELPPLRRGVLVALRVLVTLLAWLCFAQPAFEMRQVASERNTIAVLIDASESMGLAETPGGPTRLARAVQLLESPSLERWRATHDIEVYQFSNELAVMDRAAAATGPTQLREALEQLRKRFAERDLAGVLLLSDGAATGEFAAGASAPVHREFIKGLGAPVHTAWTAEAGLQDLAVARVATDDLAFARTLFRIDATLLLTGYESREVTVRLLANGVVVQSRRVGLTRDQPKVITFEVTPEVTGRFVYEVAADELADEPVKQNNTYPFVVRVLRDKLRVLHVAGNPSWDLRAMRQMLKANPNVDLISFYVLRTQDDIADVPSEEMSLIRFPTDELFGEELPSFDLIVMQDIAYGPYGLAPFLPKIAEYVARGGALVVVGGPTTFRSANYQGTALDALLPFDLGDGELIDTASFRPTLTAAGQAHPASALRSRPAANLAMWKSLPPLEGVNRVGDAKKGAAVLAVHPTLKTATGRPMPVMAVRDVQLGRVMAVTTDSLWRWGFVPAGASVDDGRAYDRLWEGAIRWLIRDPELLNLKINTDAARYAAHEAVRATARAVDADFAPLATTLTLTLTRGGDVQTKVLETGPGGDATTEWTRLRPGIYRLQASMQMGEQTITAQDVFVVEEVGHELREPQGDERTLRDIAEASGGVHLGAVTALPADLPFRAPRMVRVDARRDIAWWSWPGLFVLAVLLLGAEWLLRQRSGYL